MKSIKLLELGTPPDVIKYQDVLTQVVRRPLDPQRGADIAEMRKSIRLLDALEASNGTLELEDSDYEHLKQKLDAMQWAYVDKRIVKLVEDVETAT